MSRKTILVTGGAGYIGSHVVRQLGEAGERIVVLDDLTTGFRQAVLHGELIVGNTGDPKCLQSLFQRFDIDTVMHFAAHTVVPESVADPLKYYRNNTCASRTLLEHSLKAGVRHVVFSSTAAVYGIPSDGVASEDTPTSPINPYGHSKLMTEWMLRDVAAVNPLRYVALRYFNVAGSDPQGRIGQATPQATLLTKVACEAAVGKREHVTIFGTDYATPDGTGVRDYIHVEDLADAHLKALDYSAPRRRIHDVELRLRPRLQRPRAHHDGRERLPATRSTSAKRRAAPGTRRRWSHGPRESARRSAGCRSTTTSRRSSARRSPGNASSPPDIWSS